MRIEFCQPIHIMAKSETAFAESVLACLSVPFENCKSKDIIDEKGCVKMVETVLLLNKLECAVDIGSGF